MRHRDNRKRLKQKPAHARMLKRNLLTSLLLYESVRTTKARAKAVQPMVDRIVKMAKKSEPHNAIRYINRFVTDKNASRKVMEVFVKRYADRPSGLTRMKAVGARQGDGAHLVDFSLVDAVVATKEAPQVKKVAKKTKEVKKTEEAKKEEKVEKKTEAAAKKTTAKKKTTTTSKKKDS